MTECKQKVWRRNWPSSTLEKRLLAHLLQPETAVVAATVARAAHNVCLHQRLWHMRSRLRRQAALNGAGGNARIHAVTCASCARARVPRERVRARACVQEPVQFVNDSASLHLLRSTHLSRLHEHVALAQGLRRKMGKFELSDRTPGMEQTPELVQRARSRYTVDACCDFRIEQGSTTGFQNRVRIDCWTEFYQDDATTGRVKYVLAS
eukprot:4764124-Pleurochrysis_carterae.AAC.1